MPASACTTKLVEAVIAWPERRALPGMESEIVSGSLISYAANCGTCTTRYADPSRLRSVAIRPVATIAFQPIGSSWAERMPANRLALASLRRPTPPTHSSLSAASVRRMPSRLLQIIFQTCTCGQQVVRDKHLARVDWAVHYAPDVCGREQT